MLGLTGVYFKVMGKLKNGTAEWQALITESKMEAPGFDVNFLFPNVNMCGNGLNISILANVDSCILNSFHVESIFLESSCMQALHEIKNGVSVNGLLCSSTKFIGIGTSE